MKLINFIRNEAVLFISIILALVSMIFVLPDKSYIEYIDYRTLALLFSLMAVTGGLKQMGLFDLAANRMINRFKSMRGIILSLTLLCFFSSMIITNDVALITFVPLTLIVMDDSRKAVSDKVVALTIVMETIAANLGSMLTPIGNPQNLYLYNLSGMSLGRFLMIMIPYTVFSLVLILVVTPFLVRKSGSDSEEKFDNEKENKEVFSAKDKRKIYLYAILFILCMLTVLRILPFQILLALVLLSLLIVDRPALKVIDYSLLLTFTFLFIFIGNLGRISLVSDYLSHIVSKNTILTTIISSQFFSNVPATILLSGFTDDYRSLMIGANLGGLGTLIASMASLISYKLLVKKKKEIQGYYLMAFTALNVLFLIILLCFNMLVA